MCSRFTRTKSAAEVAAHYGARVVPALTPSFNVAPSQLVPVVKSPGVITPATWGLARQWGGRTKPPTAAKAETAATARMYRALFARKRCLVPADSFYEWPGSLNAREPFRFVLRDRALFSLAGLWDGDTFCVLTTEANELVRKVHDRMPLILAREDYGAWLDGGTPEALVRPFPAARMEAYRVSRLVNSPKNNAPACVEEA